VAGLFVDIEEKTVMGSKLRSFTVVAALLATAPAQAMSVADFLTRVEKLQGMGMMAMFKKNEINALFGEVKLVSEAYRADVTKARAAGDTSLGCPPPPGQGKMSSDQLIAHLKTIPADQRAQTPFKTVFYNMMKSRFPCK
jgi:hypothetical protein